MRRLGKKESKKAGLPPGSLIPIGTKGTDQVKITLIHYDENNFEEKEIFSVEESVPCLQQAGITWINVDGLNRVDVIEKMGAQFNLHPLLLEDIVNTSQRPKVEDFEQYLFTVMKMLRYDEQSKEVKSEQVSFILGKNYVLSFQEPDGDVFGPVRDRLRHNKGKIRKLGSDFLIYSLMDAIIDNYFIILEKLGETIENVEDELLVAPTPHILSQVHVLKREMIYLRKAVWPLRDVVANLERGHSLIKRQTELFFRDLHDHAARVIDTVETYRDVLAGMLEIYLSNISNGLNQIMKVLTAITTIFIPITFIAGVYGMNFKFMPELESKWGYPIVLLVMLLVGSSMFGYFRRKKWL